MKVSVRMVGATLSVHLLNDCNEFVSVIYKSENLQSVMQKVTYPSIKGNRVHQDCGIKDCRIVDSFTIERKLLLTDKA